MTKRIISSFGAYIDFLGGACTTENILFRGQPEDLPLLPRIARPETPLRGTLLHTEKELLREFKRQSVPHMTTAMNTDWDWLALAQHYGLPTRLLDWTKNPLAALWFAVAEPGKRGKSGVVWVFKVKRDDFADTAKEDPLRGARTKVFQPNHITMRIVSQSGWFTVHKYLRKRGGFIPFDNIARYGRQLTKLTVPPRCFSEMRYQLDRCDVNAASLFPDLDGLCRHLTWLHRSLPDERRGADRKGRAKIKGRATVPVRLARKKGRKEQ